MTIENKTYGIGDLFTTQRSKVTGVIKEIIPQEGKRSVRVKLEVEGKDRWTTATF